MARYLVLNDTVVAKSGSVVSDQFHDIPLLRKGGVQLREIDGVEVTDADVEKFVARNIIQGQKADSNLQVVGFNTTRGGDGGGGKITVENQAELALVDTGILSEGTLAFVKTYQRYFYLKKSSGVTVDPGNIVAGSGTDRWFYIDVPSYFWAMQATWFIDPVAGNDENKGDTSGTAIKTVREFNRRLRRPYLPTYTVNVLGDLPATDPMGSTSLNVPKENGDTDPRLVIFWIGQRTVAASGTFTANGANATPATNTGPSVTDTGATWTSHIGKLLVVTSGAAINATTWVAKDLGSGVARSSYWWQSTHNASTTPPSTPGTPPSSGDTYNIVNLTQVQRLYLGSKVRQIFVNFEFPNAFSTTSDVRDIGLTTFTTCRFSDGHTTQSGQSSTYNMCSFSRSTTTSFAANSNTDVSLTGCLVAMVTAGNVALVVSTNTNCILRNTIVQNGGIFSELGVLRMQAENGVFDSTSVGVDMSVYSMCYVSAGIPYGSGNTLYGMRARRGGQVRLTAITPTITGGTSDLILNAKTSIIPELQPSADVPAAANCTSWAQWSASPFSGKAMDTDGSQIWSD
jgi:hypothetical protein